MISTAVLVALLVPAVDLEPEHARNPVFQIALKEGLKAGGKAFRLPEPAFRDGMSADDQRGALRKIAGSDRAVDELVRDSITAPYILKVSDAKADGVTIRSVDLTFLIRADLGAIRPEEAFGKFEGGPIEAGNMKFETKLLTADDLKGGKAPEAGEHELFSHSTGRLLDRIAVESTDRMVWSRAGESLVFASMTDPRFGKESRWPNRWSKLTRGGIAEAAGPAEDVAGAVGYAKLTRWKADPKAAVVEVHFAFAEPLAWFDGAPILRSKFSIVAQDQVRRLRRELQKAAKR